MASSEAQLPLLPDTLQRVLPRTIPGPLSPHNRGAFHWGWQGFLAYGCQCSVIIVDPNTVQVCQSLNGHETHVTRVSWRNTQHYHQLSAAYSLLLASGDLIGQIRLWDAASGKCISVLDAPHGHKQVAELCWLPGSSEGREHLLLALYPPHKVVLWDTRHHTRIWTKTYTHTLSSFALDPFNDSNMAFLCDGGVLFVSDLHPSRCPSSNGTKFYVASPGGSSGVLESPASSSHVSSSSVGGNTLRKMKSLVVGDMKSSKTEDDVTELPCLQLCYHKTTPDRVLLLYNRELLIIDLAIKVTVGVLAIEKPASNFLQVISCWREDVLYALHESGSVSMFERRLQQSSNGEEGSAELIYDRRCQSDSLRLSKNSLCLGSAVEPVHQVKLAVLLSDGRVVLKQLTPQPTAPSPPPLISDQLDTLSLDEGHSTTDLLDSSQEDAVLRVPDLSLSGLLKSSINSKMRLCVDACVPPLPPPPSVLRMCPPLTTRNLSSYTPRAAVGSASGSIMIMNTATGAVLREISIHTSAVRGIEWTSLDSLLSFAHQPLTSANGLVRNELYHVDLAGCITTQLRSPAQQESPIIAIRVSYLKQYFLVSRKYDPLELWCCQNLSLLRTLPQRFPLPTALEWSPTSHVKKRRKRSSASESEGRQSMTDDSSESAEQMLNTSDDKSGTSMDKQTSEGDPSERVAKETFILSDAEGSLYHLSVEGNVIKDGVRVPPDPATQHITSIACKSYLMVLSDTDSNLSMWNLSSRNSNRVNTGRGWIKKIRFAPGRDNLKLLVLFSDGADVWDMKEVRRVGHTKSDNSFRVVDCDWAASDRPLLATADGSLKVMDVTLGVCSSPLLHYCTHQQIGSPYLLSSEASLNLRTLLAHQPWRKDYSFDYSENDGFTSHQLGVIRAWLSHIPPVIKQFLVSCNSTGHRSLITAGLFGDQSELVFWTLAMHYFLKVHKNEDDSTAYDLCASSNPSSNSSAELISYDSLLDRSNDAPLTADKQSEPTTTRMGDTNVAAIIEPLGAVYNLFRDSVDYRQSEYERLSLQENKLITAEQKARLCRHLSLLGEKDRAVGLLLDEDSEHPDYYTACLRACLVAASQHSAQSCSTIKLVATNLIAAGKVEEGVELLCLIGKGSEACGYLQSYGRWQESVWLIRCCPQLWKQQHNLLCKWANHFLLQGDKESCVLGLLCSCKIWETVQQLVNQHYLQRAALLLIAATEAGILPKQLLSEHRSDEATQAVTPAMISMADNIHRKYALYLFGLGNRVAVAHLCSVLGDSGEHMMGLEQ